MRATPAGQAILDAYESGTPGTKANLGRTLVHRKLVDTCAYAAHMAALPGAHLTKISQGKD